MATPEAWARFYGQEPTEAEGPLPWEDGDDYLLGELGRYALLAAVNLFALYLLLPPGLGLGEGLLRIPRDATTVYSYVALVAISALVWGFLGWQVGQKRAWMRHTTLLQTDVPYDEMKVLVRRGLKALLVPVQGEEGEGYGLLRMTTVQVREDYPPLRVVGSFLGPVTWGGARSLLLVPTTLFRHPRWGREVNELARQVLGWARDGRGTSEGEPPDVQ